MEVTCSVVEKMYQDPLLCIGERPFYFYGGHMISNNKIARMIKQTNNKKK